MSEREEEFRKSQQVETVESPEMEQRSKDWRKRFYEEHPYKERRSTGERVEKNAFYMPKVKEDPTWYNGYSASDFFGLETERIIPLTPEEKRAVDWGYEEEEK